jgi:hypothetical protein
MRVGGRDTAGYDPRVMWLFRRPHKPRPELNKFFYNTGIYYYVLITYASCLLQAKNTQCFQTLQLNEPLSAFYTHCSVFFVYCRLWPVMSGGSYKLLASPAVIICIFFAGDSRFYLVSWIRHISFKLALNPATFLQDGPEPPTFLQDGPKSCYIPASWPWILLHSSKLALNPATFLQVGPGSCYIPPSCPWIRLHFLLVVTDLSKFLHVVSESPLLRSVVNLFVLNDWLPYS